MPVSYVKLKGLTEDAIYENIQTGQCYYGSVLMHAGVPLPIELVEYPAYQIEFKKKETQK